MAKLCEVFRISPRRSRELVKLNRTTWYYKSRAKNAAVLAMRLRYGCQRLYELLRREGWHVNHKRVHRLYMLAGLQDRIRRKIERASHIRAPLPKPSGVNEHWSMDFMHDVLDNGKQFRILTMVDKFSRESPLGEADFSMDAGKVITCLERLKITRGLPQAITVDNSTEFYSRAMDSWAYRNKVQLDFIKPGKPVKNAFIESFNSRLRDECWNVNLFFSLEDAHEKLEAWWIDCNTERPHSSIGNLAPEEIARQQKRDPLKAEFFNLQAV